MQVAASRSSSGIGTMRQDPTNIDLFGTARSFFGIARRSAKDVRCAPAAHTDGTRSVPANLRYFPWPPAWPAASITASDSVGCA
jgi:hypothetical protein